MTIDEAIKHAEEVAEENRNVDEEELGLIYCDDTECIENHKKRCLKCADEHEQLAGWLKDYKRLLKQKPCEDAISRRELINKIEILETYGSDFYWETRKIIDSIPPIVTPKVLDSNTIEYNRGYRDGYEKGDLNGYNLRKSEKKNCEPCEDAISRKQALEALEWVDLEEGYDYEKVEDMLNSLPPVTPIRKKGEWIKTGQSFINPNKFLCYSCSECGFGAKDLVNNHFKFCPNCGAEMKSEL